MWNYYSIIKDSNADFTVENWISKIKCTIAKEYLREHSHMTSDVFWAFFTYLTLSDEAWPKYLPKNLTSDVNAHLDLTV